MTTFALARPVGALPIPPTPLIGREREIAVARGLLLDEGVALVTLLGPGGSGKTRLALALGHDLWGRFADGTLFLDLSPLTDPGLVLPAMAQALGLADTNEQALRDHIVSALQSRQMLLIVDNCEHVVASVSELVALVLATCPAVQVLATSRAPLHVRAEQVFPVPPLTLPEAGTHALEALAQNEAVTLFVQRARAVAPGFALTEENAETIAALCQHLEGLPLAIELAASWTRLLPPVSLLERLRTRLLDLGGGPRDAPARQQTIHDTIAWSNDLLGPDERELFARLSVFEGGFTLEAVEALGSRLSALGSQDDESRESAVVSREWGDCAPASSFSSSPSPVTHDPSPSVLGLMTALLDQSLIRQVEQGEQPRFAMLEMIRAFAAERLAERGEGEAVRACHAAYFLALAEEAEPHLRGAEQSVWLDRLEMEHPNLRDALRWFREQGDLQCGLRLAGALGRFFEVRGHVAEGRRILDGLLAQTERASVPPAILARALSQAGTLAWAQSDFGAALERHQAALERYREVGDAWGIAFSITCIGTQRFGLGDLEEARRLFGEGHERFQALGDAWGTALAQTNLGVIAQLRSEMAEAERAFAEARALFQTAGAVDELALISIFLGRVISERGDQGTAWSLLDEGIAQIEASGSRYQLAYARYQLAFVIQARGDHREAIASFVESVLLCRDQGDLLGYAQSAEGMATSLVALGFHQRAARLLAAADQIRQSLAAPLPPAETPAVERATAAARGALGTKGFATAAAAGKRLTPAQALAEMLAPLPEPAVQPDAEPRPARAPATPMENFPGFDLTRRELEVLGLLARRFTDAEIAEHLFISPKTASNHVANILSKLGASNRREAAAIAARQALV